jgi:hypothetical protein
MAGSYEHLLQHLHAERRRLYLAAVPAEGWGRALLDLELGRADYAALPAFSRGWLVLSTAPPAGVGWADVTGIWEDALPHLGHHCDHEALVLSEGWAAGAQAAALRPACVTTSS